MALHKWLPVKVVDKFLLVMASIMLGNTSHYGIRRPKTGPIELKLATGKTPVLDVGQVAQIKSGNIKVQYFKGNETTPIYWFKSIVRTKARGTSILSFLRLRFVGFCLQVMEGVKEITRNGAKFVDGQQKEFDAIILATGYKSNVPTWLKVKNLTWSVAFLALSYYEALMTYHFLGFGTHAESRNLQMSSFLHAKKRIKSVWGLCWVLPLFKIFFLITDFKTLVKNWNWNKIYIKNYFVIKTALLISALRKTY